MKKSTIIKLGVVAALIMLPRRSSKKSGCGTGCGCSNTNAKTTDKAETSDKNPAYGTSGKKGCDCKHCICPLCRIGKCPLCAIGKCFCCKKSANKVDEKTEK